MSANATRAQHFRHFRTQDGVLARIRHERAVPEVFHETTRKWAPYPELDTIHDVTPITADEARSVPAKPLTAAELARVEGAKAPVR